MMVKIFNTFPDWHRKFQGDNIYLPNMFKRGGCLGKYKDLL